jgi:hypothetical protein
VSGGFDRAHLDALPTLVARLEEEGAVVLGLDAFAVTFAFEPSAIAFVVETALSLASSAVRWSAGLAVGDLEAIAFEGALRPPSGSFWFGAPLRAASLLAHHALSGEVLCEETVSVDPKHVGSEERLVHDGTLVVRGKRLGGASAVDYDDEPDSMIEHARIVPPAKRSPSAEDSHPATLTTPEPAGSPVPRSVHPTLPPFRVSESAFLSTPPAPSRRGAPDSSRLGDLAKDALLGSDDAALEQWIDGLNAAGESPIFTERLHALARLNRGEIGGALRALRRTRAKLDAHDHRRRCQTSLALAVALRVAGRPQEALLESLDALSRARQTNDTRGVKACLAFLVKLYTSVSRDALAGRLREAAG